MTPEEKRRELLRKQLAARQLSAGVSGAKNQIKTLTDQAKAAYSQGNDEEGKRLLVEASRLSADSGIAPEGFTADPRTGGMVDLQTDPTIPDGGLTALGVGAMQGLGYNLGDEAIGGIAAVTGGDPRFAMERAREMDRRAQENPLAYYGGMVPGAVASSLSAGKALGLGPALRGTFGQRVGAGAALGGLEGAASGFGGGENMQDRITNAAIFGGVGTVAGAAAPVAVKGVSEGWDKLVAGPAASMRSAPSEIRASRALRTALERSGMSADDIDAALARAASEGQPMFTVADALGNPGQRMLSGIARTPNDARKEIVDFLTTRQDGQGNRIAGFLTEALDAPDTAAQRAANLTAARGAAADTAYSAAREGAGPVNLTPTIETIDDLLNRNPILGESALGNTEIGNRLVKLRSQLQAGGQQLIDFDQVLNVKQDLGVAIQGLKSSGKSVPPQLAKVYGELDSALEAASDGYRAANDGFAKASRAIDAVDAGSSSASSRMRYQDVADQYTALGNVSDEAKNAFRAGRADAEIARIDAAAPGVNKARPLLSEKSSQELSMMANDPRLLADRIGREQTMFETNATALGGSRTADNLADIADTQAFDYGPVVNALTGNFRAAAMQMGPTVLNAMQGRNTATREMIARALLGTDIKRAIAPALAAETKAGPRRAVVEALVRGLPRPATN